MLGSYVGVVWCKWLFMIFQCKLYWQRPCQVVQWRTQRAEQLCVCGSARVCVLCEQVECGFTFSFFLVSIAIRFILCVTGARCILNGYWWCWCCGRCCSMIPWWEWMNCCVRNGRDDGHRYHHDWLILIVSSSVVNNRDVCVEGFFYDIQKVIKIKVIGRWMFTILALIGSSWSKQGIV